MQNAPKTHMTDGTDGRIGIVAEKMPIHFGKVNLKVNHINGFVSQSVDQTRLMAARGN